MTGSKPSGGQRLRLGWREWVSLPGLGVDRIKAKVDTGARSSSLHALGIERFERNGRPMVRFDVHPVQRDTSVTVSCEARLRDQRRVRTSGGHQTVRPVIVTEVQVGTRRWEIEITLASREMMGFRMLLGRQALRGRFVVDPGASFLAGGRPTGGRAGGEELAGGEEGKTEGAKRR